MAGTLLRSGTITNTFLHEMPHADQLAIESVQDVEAIIDLNKAQYNSTDERARFSPLGSSKEVPIARIPMVVYMELVQKGIIKMDGSGDEKEFNAWLNNPDNRMFRTRPGRI